MITIVEKRTTLHEVVCDELVLGLYTGQQLGGALASLHDTLGGALADLMQQKEVSGEFKSVAVIHTLGKLPAKKLIFVGLGDQTQVTAKKVRDAYARAVKIITAKGENKRVAVYLGEGHRLAMTDVSRAITEAFTLATYTYEGYRQKPSTKVVLSQVEYYVESTDLREATAGYQLGEALALGTNYARDLTNMPSNYLTPTALKDEIVAKAEAYGLPYQVFGPEQLQAMGAGGILSVAQGSNEPAFMVTVRYQGRETWDDVVGLIGKGVTFDTGGISIKGVAGMDEMKSDMGGAAAVVGALDAIARLKPAVNLLFVVGCVENMPSGTAYKPGDVITTLSGKTVEIITTDAEGRLVLADCLTYAQQQEGISCLIDCATLTGGISVALGTISSGAISNNQALVNDVLQSAEQAGERLWQLPAFEEYSELNKSRFADIKNSGGRQGHPVIAGMFLKAFVDDKIPWVHLDNAGTAYLSAASDLGPSGATGSMTRTIAQFVLNRSTS